MFTSWRLQREEDEAQELPAAVNTSLRPLRCEVCWSGIFLSHDMWTQWKTAGFGGRVKHESGTAWSLKQRTMRTRHTWATGGHIGIMLSRLISSTEPSRIINRKNLPVEISEVTMSHSKMLVEPQRPFLTDNLKKNGQNSNFRHVALTVFHSVKCFLLWPSE